MLAVLDGGLAATGRCCSSTASRTTTWSPAHTLRLSAALLAAGRPHEVLPLPGATHMPVSEAATENLLLHELDFLRRALGLPQPAAR